MCTVRELIDKLEKLDPETTVEVLSVYTDSCGGSNHEWVDLDITDYWGENKSETFDYLDLKDSLLATEEERNNIPMLLLGEC